METGIHRGFANPQMMVSTLTPLHDTYIDSASPGTNNSSGTTLSIGGGLFGTTTTQRYALLTFDISKCTGKYIAMAKLRLVHVADGSTGIGVAVNFAAKEMLRAYSPEGVTWNVSQLGSPWATAGAGGVDTDTSGVTYSGFVLPINTAPCDYYIDMLYLLRKAADAGSSILRLLLLAPNGTTSLVAVNFHSLESTTVAYRPSMIVLC